MGYLDGYFNSERPDYSAPNLTGLYQFVQSGYDAGKAKAQNQALAQLSQKAYTDTGDAQQQDIAQKMGIDPATGMKQAQFSQQQSAQKQAQQQTALQRFGKAASAIIEAKQRGDNATAEGIYQSLVPELRAFSAQNGGPEPPPTVDGSDMGALYKLAAMYGQMPTPDKGVVVSAGGAVVDPVTGKVMASVPFKPSAPQLVGGRQIVTGPDGVAYYRDVLPVGAQNGMGVDQAVPGAPAGGAPQTPNQTVTGADGTTVRFNFAPGTPQAVIDQTYATAKANGDIPASAPQSLHDQLVADKQKPVIGGDNSGGMSPDATYYAAWNYNLTGKMPPFGMGGSSARVGVYNEAAKIAKEAGVSPSEMRTVQGRQKALTASLTNLQKQSDVMERQMIAMHNNISVAEGIIKQVDNGSFKSMNALKNAVRLQMGDEGVAQLNTALNAVATDYGKIMSGATGAAGASETELQHARKLMDPTMSPEQLRGVFSVLAQDTEGQVNAAHSKEAAIGDLMGSFGTGGNTSPGGAQPTQTAQSPIGATPQSGWSIQKVQ